MEDDLLYCICSMKPGECTIIPWHPLQSSRRIRQQFSFFRAILFYSIPAWPEPRSKVLGDNLHWGMRSYRGSHLCLAPLICLIVNSSLNHWDATDITGRPWTLLGVQTVMGISIDIGLKGSVSRLFTPQVSRRLPIHTKKQPSDVLLSPGAPTLLVISKKMQGALLPNAP